MPSPENVIFWVWESAEITELLYDPVRYKVSPDAILIVVSSFAPTSTAFTY